MSSNSQSKANHTGPFLILVGLFFVVGFLTVVNQQFQSPLQESLLANTGSLKNTLTTLITFAFFMGYPAFGGVASKWADQKGYKNTLIIGLIMLVGGLGIEALSAYSAQTMGEVALSDAQVPIAFFIFILGSFALGSSLAVLQTVINPFIAVCSVPGTSSVTRMSIGGSANSIGTTAAPFFVTYLVFGGGAPQVDNLVMPLVILMLTVVVVTLVLKKLHLPNPDVAGDDVDSSSLTKSVWSFSHLKWGVVGIFVYVGVEVAIGSNLFLYAKDLGFTKDAATQMTSFYWGGMLVGRLVGSFLSRVSGQRQLLVTAGVATILVVAGMLTNMPWLFVAVGLMHSIMWGAIFSLAIDKLGPYTSKASGALMIGVAGGAVIPWLQGIMADVVGGWEMTWILVILGELYLVWYAVAGHKVNESEIAEIAQ